MKKCFAILFILCSQPALAVNTYNPDTGILKLDAVVVNDTQFNDVQVKLNSIEVQKVGSNQPYGNVADTCTDANFTVEKFNAITQGMSLDKVNQAIGCKFNPSLTGALGETIFYAWNIPSGLKLIQVYFNASNNLVVSNSNFKMRSGF